MSETPDPRTNEARHAPPEMPGWREWWGFDFVAPAHDLAGWSELALFPGSSIAWYHAFVVGRHRQMVAVVDHAVPLPVRTLELRTHGLWADHICETPGVHWTIGLEAFGVGLDDPDEMYGRQLGDVVPLGFDLEWESDDTAGATIETVAGTVSGYSLACEVSGEVLVGSEALDIQCTGTRHHRWGTPIMTTTVDGRSVAPDDIDVSTDPRQVSGRGTAVVSGRGAVELVARTPLPVPDPLGSCRRPRALVTDSGSADDWFWIDWTEQVV